MLTQCIHCLVLLLPVVVRCMVSFEAFELISGQKFWSTQEVLSQFIAVYKSVYIAFINLL